MRIRRIVAAGLAAAAFWGGSAEAGSFGRLITFGDSLSDTGNAYTASGGAGEFGPGGLFPTPPFYQGRISNGPVWVEHVAGGLGLSGQTTAALLGGNNYAFGGADTIVGGNSPFGVPSVTEQVGMFLAGSPVNGPTDLAVLWSGGNDILYGEQTPEGFVARALTAATAIGGLLGVLADSGIEHFLVPNLPGLGMTPETNGLPQALRDQLNGVSALFNMALEAELQALEVGRGVTIHRLDVFGLFATALADPASFGLTNVTDAAFLDIDHYLTGDEADGYLFWDSRHPSATGHRLLGQAALLAVPEPSSLALGGLGLAGLALAARRRRRASA